MVFQHKGRWVARESSKEDEELLLNRREKGTQRIKSIPSLPSIPSYGVGLFTLILFLFPEVILCLDVKLFKGLLFIRIKKSRRKNEEE